MRQRVAFLRTLLSGKPVLALDEPFASLDAITRAEMQEWLAGALRADPRTVVLVTHDVEEALYLSDRVVVLSARPARIVAELRAPAAAGRRPRRRRHRPRVRRRPRAGDAGAARGLAVKRWLLPALLLAALVGAWQLAASSGVLAEVLGLEEFLVPSPVEVAELALAQPLAAGRKRLGDAAGDPPRLRLRPPRRPRLRGAPAPVRDAAARRLSAARRLPGDPDRRLRADPGRLVRLRDRPQAGDRRRRSASSRSPSTRSTACAPSTRRRSS